MKAKLFELRDRATFVPVVAVKLEPENEAEIYLLRRAGFNLEEAAPILLAGIDGGLNKATTDPYEWCQNGTRLTAHQYLEKHFDDLAPGAVICTEFIRGERSEPKTSERLGNP